MPIDPSPSGRTRARVSLVLLALLGCHSSSGGASSGPVEGGPAPAASSSGAAPAASAPAVSHYPDEVHASREPLTTRMFAIARTQASPTGGSVLAQLPPGTRVEKLSSRAGFDLVSFPDPRGAGSPPAREGWVSDSAFTTPTPVPSSSAPAGK